MSNNALTVPMRSAAMDLSPATWDMMKEQAGMLVKSGFLPNSIKTPEQAVTVMLKGRELDIPAMQAFSHIHVIQGKPTISAELMLALIYKHCPGAKIEYVKYEIDGCHIEATRPGHRPALFKFERADAEAAQLLGKDNWRKFPRAMYRSRCISEMARSVFPDCLMGCSYTPEEINPDVSVNEEGVVIDIEHTVPKSNAVPQEAKQHQPDQQRQGATTAPRVFEATPDQVKVLEDILRKQKIPQNHWPEISDRLMGKSSTELPNIIEPFRPKGGAK